MESKCRILPFRHDCRTAVFKLRLELGGTVDQPLSLFYPRYQPGGSRWRDRELVEGARTGTTVPP